MLGPCPSCRRHVRVDERACPFCGAAVAVTATPAATARLTRAAIMAFTTTLGAAAAVVGCPRSPEPVVQPYGAPPTPTPPDTGTPDADVPETEQAVTPPVTPPVALYGAPPPPPNQ